MKTKKRFGDRQDATLVRNMDSLHKLMVHIYPNRTDCEVHFSENFDITELLKYINTQNEQHPEYKTTLFHAILTAFAKIIHNRPILNRFIMGRKFYQRDDILFGFNIKKKFEDTAEEILLLHKVKKDMTLNSFSNYLANGISQKRAGKTDNADIVVETLTKLPRFLTTFIMWLMKTLDYFNLLPLVFVEGDPNYATVFFTNLGSIKCPAVFHHINNWGTNSIFCAIGTMQKTPFFDENGAVTMRDTVNIKIVLDERIGDGFYFAKSLKLIQKLFDNPKLLNQPIHEELL